MSNRNTSGYGMTGLDYWRLSDELSVIDAAFLTLNLDPGCFELSDPSNPATSKIIKVAELEEWQERALFNGDAEQIEYEPNRFRAVFKGLRNAVLGNKLRAKVVTRAREAVFENTEYGDVDVGAGPNEGALYYEYLLANKNPGLFTNSQKMFGAQAKYGEPNGSDDAIYFLKEPDWSETTLEIDEIRAWYSKRGVQSAFFFPNKLTDGFRDKNDPRYTAKLATAVAAWEAVRSAGKNKSVKQTLLDWIVSNGVQFGLGNSESIVTQTVADEVAKIANWQTGGGATRTSTGYDIENEDIERPIQNFVEVDPDIPF